MSSDNIFANRHIPLFQAYFKEESASYSPGVQVVQDGRQLTAESLKQGKINISLPILITDTRESIGMTVFQPSAVDEGIEEKVTVRHIADVIGFHFPVRVMDVEHQEELKGWTLGDLVDYFEDEDRLRYCQKKGQASDASDEDDKVDTTSGRRKRKAAEKATNKLLSERDKPRILNQISLEYSRTALGPRVKSPQFVRDLDWIGTCWPTRQNKAAPSVQYYCLTSTEGCFTDFHCDFGGSSVYYHVLSGAKMFILIKPSKENLKIYEQWLGQADQESLFLPDSIPNPQDVIKVHLQTSQTLFIPTGYIHAVYTPQDAIVLGGNFLHCLDIPIQLEVAEIEERTRVATRFRFPHFRKLHFYAAGVYLQKLRDKKLVDGELKCLPDLLKALEMWYREAIDTHAGNDPQKGKDVVEAALYAAKLNGYQSVSDFLQVMKNEYEADKRGDSSGADSSHALKKTLSIRPPTKPHATNALGSPKSPKLRRTLNRGSLNKASPAASPRPNNDKPDETFRIVVSSVAKELHQALPRVRRNPRTERLKEAYEYVEVDKADDEWVPEAATRKQNVGKKRKGAASCPVANQKAANAQVSTKGKGLPAAKKRTSVQQRLLKKFR